MSKKIEAFFAYSLIGLAIVCCILLVVAIVSIPFALLGWILLLAVSIFTDVTITYISCVIIGLAAFIIGHLISK